ncbi:MAG: hypothetical protein BGO69_02275 [Bacteroidetes bacterium 46-16]|nr:MAG: hypothetical protein BGO69_02275 [Bacteroidetes bacterium 46-16]
MIEINTAWNFIRNNAQKAEKLNVVFHSRRNQVPYQIRHVAETYLLINRNGEPSRLSQTSVENAIKRLNNNAAPLFYEDFMDGSVANETCTVLFHPQLNWTEDGTHVTEV